MFQVKLKLARSTFTLLQVCSMSYGRTVPVEDYIIIISRYNHKYCMDTVVCTGTDTRSYTNQLNLSA
jgi:Tfp pilus assembly ATPase PilU